MITSHGQTDIGKRRSLNEDAIFVGDGLFIVCDGMGGHKAGEVAARLGIDAIVRFVERSLEDAEIPWPYGLLARLSLDGNRLRSAIKLANEAILRHAASSNDYTGMGTTVAVALVSRDQPRMTYATVGDSRVYLLRGAGIQQLTSDDSWANLSWKADAVDELTRAAMQHVLTKALGAEEAIDFDVKVQDLANKDIVLLCSDGLTSMVSDGRISQIITVHGADLEGACRELVSEANAQGGRDNISVILARYTS
jgi:serine/threonine protein phosphatase PrpC